MKVTLKNDDATDSVLVTTYEHRDREKIPLDDAAHVMQPGESRDIEIGDGQGFDVSYVGPFSAEDNAAEIEDQEKDADEPGEGAPA